MLTTIFNQYKVSETKIIYFFIFLSCFSIAMPTAWMSISTFCLLVFWLISGRWGDINQLRKSSAVIAALGLLVIYVFSFFYSSAPSSQALNYLMKYLKLLIIPIIVTSIYSKKIRNYAINIFLISIGITLFLSYAKWLHLIPDFLNLHLIDSPDQGFIVYKNRITQGILMAFAMYMMLCNFYYESSKNKWTWLFLAFLCFFNLFYLINGRSGQIISLCLIVYFIWDKYGKGSLKPILLCLLLGLAFYPKILPFLPERLTTVYTEIKEHDPKNNMTSAGIRIEMYQHALTLIKKSPFFGYGVGSVETEYEKLVEVDQTLLKKVTNPHNQYLLVLIETGIVGFILFVSIFYFAWVGIKNLHVQENRKIHDFMKGLIITFALGCLLNSLLLDAGEGKFFCLMIGLFLSAQFPKARAR